MSNSSQTYEVTKTVRFILQANDDGSHLDVPTSSSIDLSKLCENLKKIQTQIGKVLYDPKRNQMFSQFEIKYTWLRTYTKNHFYDWLKEQQKKYPLSSISYLPEEFDRWDKEWEDLCQHLYKVSQLPPENQERRSDISSIIRKISIRRNFEFIKEFVGSIVPTNNPHKDQTIHKLKESIDEAEEQLTTAQKEYLPAQTAGLQIAKATLNYYSLNKCPTEYNNQISNIKNQLKQPLSDKDQQTLYELGFSPVKSFIDENGKHKTQCTNPYKKEEIAQLSLDTVYHEIKQWKAVQKQQFNERVQEFLSQAKEQGYCYQDLTQEKQQILEDFPLFRPKQEQYFNTYLDNSSQLQDLQAKKASKECIKQCAQKRGEFFNKPGQTIQTQNYHDVCKIFKCIATKRGNLKAQLRGIEQEQILSQQLQYWALIGSDGAYHYLHLVPRTEVKNAKKCVETCSQGGDSDYTLYHFKTLSLRALDKLLFKQYNNTFREGLKNEGVCYKYSKATYSEVDLIQLYQKVLKTTYVKKTLDLVDFGTLDDVLNSQYTSLDHFKKDLEAACYIKKPVSLTESQKQTFIKTYTVNSFRITSYDLRIEQDKPDHCLKTHTGIWKNFWSGENKDNHYPVRLNPELSLLYREADPRYRDKQRHRRKQEQYTLQTQITFNAGAKNSQLAFKETSSIKDYVETFNTNFNQQFIGDWYYGIDRGTKELATLTIVKFAPEKNTYDQSTYQQFAKIPVRQVDQKKCTKHGYPIDHVRKNPSYYWDKDIFLCKSVSGIDLTTAKLIKGHIFLDGDVNTYYRLKMISAKRKLWNIFSEQGSSVVCSIKLGRNKCYLQYSETVKTEPLYHLRQEEKQDQKWKNQIKKELEEYQEAIRQNSSTQEDISIDKINHLRDALSANAVGIITHLQFQYPGIIALENMDEYIEQRPSYEKKGRRSQEKTGRTTTYIEDHFVQHNQDISRRLEFALYTKFQYTHFNDNQHYVPPNIKRTVLLKQDFSQYQFGILKFVKIGGTSSQCPQCNTSVGKTNGHFVCGNCYFSSKENKYLCNSDQVAAYNIAKNAYDNILS